jgi:hypothetical protein
VDGFLGPYPLTWVVPLQLGGVAERDVIDVDQFLGLGLHAGSFRPTLTGKTT